mmetsp:Transcript_1955/g.4016  ORF Transcript_1955/g.4016 Transcript_1955/m.4016 type:complete len:283 (-) Transcript_1955:446-1294(-)
MSQLPLHTKKHLQHARPLVRNSTARVGALKMRQSRIPNRLALHHLRRVSVCCLGTVNSLWALRSGNRHQIASAEVPSSVLRSLLLTLSLPSPSEIPCPGFQHAVHPCILGLSHTMSSGKMGIKLLLPPQHLRHRRGTLDPQGWSLLQDMSRTKQSHLTAHITFHPSQKRFQEMVIFTDRHITFNTTARMSHPYHQPYIAQLILIVNRFWRQIYRLDPTQLVSQTAVHMQCNIDAVVGVHTHTKRRLVRSLCCHYQRNRCVRCRFPRQALPFRFCAVPAEGVV